MRPKIGIPKAEELFKGLVSIAVMEHSCISTKKLFVSTAYKKQCEQKSIQFSKTYPNGKTLQVRLAVQLGGFHLLLLEALVAMTQNAMYWIKKETKPTILKKIRRKLKLKYQSADDAVLVITATPAAIAQQMGKPMSSMLARQIEEALIDLGGVQFVWRDAKGNPIEAFNLISHILFQDAGEEDPLLISLSPALSSVILEGNQRGFFKVDMDEIRKINNQPTIILHAWLSSIIKPGKKKNITFQKIISEVIWNDQIECGSPAWRRRKFILIHNLLPDLACSGWQYEINGEKITFFRPNLGSYPKNDEVEKENAIPLKNEGMVINIHPQKTIDVTAALKKDAHETN